MGTVGGSCSCPPPRTRRGAPERTLYVCGWRGKGIDSRPVLQDTWKVPHEAVFWDVGPAGEAGEGKHVYFLSLDGLSEVGKFGFPPNLRIEAPVLLSVGQEDEFLWMDFIRDWDGDGREEAMLPLGRQVRFYRWGGTEGWALVDSAKILAPCVLQQQHPLREGPGRLPSICPSFSILFWRRST